MADQEQHVIMVEHAEDGIVAIVATPDRARAHVLYGAADRLSDPELRASLHTVSVGPPAEAEFIRTLNVL